jgi:hypothetical protein
MNTVKTSYPYTLKEFIHRVKVVCTETMWQTVANSDTSSKCILLKTSKEDIWSMKLVLIPCINTVYRWICWRTFFWLFKMKCSIIKIYTGMEPIKSRISLTDFYIKF